MTEQIVTGSLVIGVGFILDIEYNDRLGEVVECLGEMAVKNKGDNDGDSTVSTECFMVKWQEQEEPDLIRRANLKLVPPVADEGEQSVLELFKMLPSRYNFDFHEEIRKEMQEERELEGEMVE